MVGVNDVAKELMVIMILALVRVGPAEIFKVGGWCEIRGVNAYRV